MALQWMVALCTALEFRAGCRLLTVQCRIVVNDLCRVSSNDSETRSSIVFYQLPDLLNLSNNCRLRGLSYNIKHFQSASFPPYLQRYKSLNS